MRGKWLWPLVAAVAPAAAFGQAPAENLPDMTVQGQRAEGRLDFGSDNGTLPAQVEQVDADSIERLPVAHVTDLFRTVAGAVPGNIDQGDVGNDFGLRGFSGGHGRETAVFVDGVPMNVRNGRAHGLVDLSWLQPEMIQRIEVVKGPFSALYGDFALGGAINIITRDQLDSAVSAQVGRFDEARLLASQGGAVGQWQLSGLAEVWHSNGYRDNSGGERYNAFGKVRRTLGDYAVDVSLHAAARDFGAPGYLPVADVLAGRNPRDALNDQDGGRADVARLTVNLRPTALQGWHATAYGGTDRRDRFATFVDGGDQNHDRTERDYGGARLFYMLPLSSLALIGGVEAQFDRARRARFLTDGARNDGPLQRDRRSDVLASGLFVQAQWRPIDTLQWTAGLRYDRFDTEVDNRITPENSGEGAPDIVSPKLGVAWQPSSHIEVFANMARGFRSPSAEELSPDAGQPSFDRLDPLALDSVDVGAVWRPSAALSLTAALYRTETEGEIVQTGGSDEFVNVGSTTRNGFEWIADWQMSPLTRVYAAFTGVNADLDRGGVVTNVPEDVQTLGIESEDILYGARVTVAGYLQRYGETPLTADGTMVRPAITRIASELRVLRGAWSVHSQLVYLPDRFASESQFGFAGGVYSPKPEVDVRVCLRYQFQ